MILDAIGRLFVVGSALAVVGCGYSCESFCEDEAECSGSATSAAACEKGCEDLERKNADFGCTDDYEALLACLGDLDDVCDAKLAKRECGDETTAWGDCIIDHCSDHPTAEGCQGTTERRGPGLQSVRR